MRRPRPPSLEFWLWFATLAMVLACGFAFLYGPRLFDADVPVLQPHSNARPAVRLEPPARAAN